MRRLLALVVGMLALAATLGSACIGSTPTSGPLNGAALQPPKDLPPLTLLRSDGGSFTTADTRGRLSLFFFGYTHCADVCPLTLSQLARLRTQVYQVDMYFVTVDPSRDTPERTQTYLENFPGI